MLRFTFLGTGNASGTPVYGCTCPACMAAMLDPSHRRRTSSALLESAGSRLLLDAGHCDLSERFPPGALDGILVTHFHTDHVLGLLHWRWGVGVEIPVYCPPDAEGCADLYKHPGILRFHQVTVFESFTIGDFTITPIPLRHSKLAYGYAVAKEGARIAYLTDTVGLPPETVDFLADFKLDMMAVDCSYPPKSDARGSHNNLDQALALIGKIAPRQGLLTHLDHTMDVWLAEHGNDLPERVAVAQDGMVLQWC